MEQSNKNFLSYLSDLCLDTTTEETERLKVFHNSCEIENEPIICISIIKDCDVLSCAYTKKEQMTDCMGLNMSDCEYNVFLGCFDLERKIFEIKSPDDPCISDILIISKTYCENDGDGNDLTNNGLVQKFNESIYKNVANIDERYAYEYREIAVFERKKGNL